MAQDNDSLTDNLGQEAKERPVCGLVRPIATVNEFYPLGHWQEVHDIVGDAAGDAGFNLRLVSEGGGASIIVSEIIDHLYHDPLTIVDVSSRNPNVMFELGMRVAFEKPVIIIKDDATEFSFDITPIRHTTYQRDLRHSRMMVFREELSETIRATVEATKAEKYKHYLRQFGPIEVTKLETQKISADELAKMIQDMQRDIGLLTKQAGAPVKNTAREAAQFDVLANIFPEKGSLSRRHVFEAAVDISKADTIVRRLSIEEGVTAAPILKLSDKTIVGIAYPKSFNKDRRLYLERLIKDLDENAEIHG